MSASSVSLLSATSAGVDDVALARRLALGRRRFLMAEAGLTEREIAARLFLTENTVKTHVLRLYRKLDAHDRALVVAIGFRKGWLA